MMRYKLLLFLILLPLLTKSKNVRPKRPQSYADQETNTQFPLIDQLALADNWKSPSRVISATYSGDPETGRVNHANLVINIVPRANKKPANVDIIASQSLANAKTAEEYVSKALEMKHKYDHTTPSSSFVKYDIYEKEQTKRVPAHATPTPLSAIRIEEPNDSKNQIDTMVGGDTEKSSSDFHEYYHSPAVQSTTITTTYKNPDDLGVYGSYKDLDGANTDFSHQLASANYDVFGTINNINYDNQKSYSSALQRVPGGSGAAYPSKQEVFDYIERAVKKYMREMESEGKLSSSAVSTITGAPTAHAEIKTYYRFPSSTVATPVTSTKLYSMGTHSEFFKPAKSNTVKISGVYSTVKPFVVESYTPDTIDLTVRSKKRPKPIDLSALDVGQSWSHSASSEPAVTHHHRKPHKPKLHFNSQTYHDINALPYAPNRGIIYDEYSPSTSYPDLANAHTSLSVKDHPVGASISFGSSAGGSSYEPEESVKSPHFTPSMQVLNGVPVTNPYKFNMETLNDIFDTAGSRVKDSSSSSIAESEYGGSSVAWNPYGFDLSSSKESASGSGYTFDTYNPKYNNNPEGHGYQDSYKYSVSGEYDGSSGSSGEHYYRQRGTIGSDMYASGSSHRPKKISSNGSSHQKRQPKSQKVKVKQRTSKRFSQHSRDLERDLTPPPADY